MFCNILFYFICACNEYELIVTGQNLTDHLLGVHSGLITFGCMNNHIVWKKLKT